MIYKEILDDTEIVLLARLGGFKEQESGYLIASDNKEKNNAFYKNHLGRLGLASMCEILEPDLCLICEFGEEFKGNRSTIADIFNLVFSESGKQTKFIPEEIGVVISFTDSIEFRHIVNPIDTVSNDYLKKDYKFIDSRPCLRFNELSLIYNDSLYISDFLNPDCKYFGTCSNDEFKCGHNKPIFEALRNQIPDEVINYIKKYDTQ
jgi:hypothetical protein